MQLIWQYNVKTVKILSAKMKSGHKSIIFLRFPALIYCLLCMVNIVNTNEWKWRMDRRTE